MLWSNVNRQFSADMLPVLEGPIICFSHLRWDSVRQRPQHLMERFANQRQVFFFEEYIPTDHHLAYFEIHSFDDSPIKSIRPRIPGDWDNARREAALAKILDEIILLLCSAKPILWFYTPMMFAFARHVDSAAIVYDCMDELASFKFAPSELKHMERLLIGHADVVFTGGFSLYESKRLLHENIHPFPSGVETDHFKAARNPLSTPVDQAVIGGPRLGFYGVIDERLDLELIAFAARELPECSFVFVGPVAKIDKAELPVAPNIHYLGQKDYAELPAYLAGWDVALMPFALNESTRFISPTKTPEYLASGRPVVSTKITDVVRHYGDVDGVLTAATPSEFVAACRKALKLPKGDARRIAAIDARLGDMSWDSIQQRMQAIVEEAIEHRGHPLGREKLRDNRVFSIANPGKPPFDYLIVGAGFAGSVLAERLASAGHQVLISDRRSHVGGNAYDYYNEDGLLVHKYGPHIFHTNSEEIFHYLSRFTQWRAYEHRVLSSVNGQLLPVPINRTTLNRLYDLRLSSDAETAAFLLSKAQAIETIQTAKDVVRAQVGDELYELFFEGYTRKQWGFDPSELDKSVTARIPTRTNDDDRYFLDTFQVMPLHGYTRMFENMLDRPGITIELATDFEQLRDLRLASHTIFTGPIDEYFDFRLGKLPYRSLNFLHQTIDRERFQDAAVINFPSEDIPYTRITEYKYLTGQSHPKTSICYETPCADGDPYYPIPRPENQAIYKQYEALAKQQSDVSFVGRLGTYKYYNMDQVVGQALATFKRLMQQAGHVDQMRSADQASNA